eukprot:scaffold27.g5971.t1
MVRECEVARAALLKILLHAAKFPTSGVCGILIGALQTTAEAAGPHIRVYDAIPLLHTFITLTPMLETALAQMEEHLEQQRQQAGGGGDSGLSPLRVVGYYQCNERLDDTDLGPAGRRVADRVDAVCPDSVALVLDAKALQQQLEGGGGGAPVMRLFHRDGGRGWARAHAGGELLLACPSSGLAELLGQLMSEGRHRRLADFEDHLGDIRLDWLNAGLLD